MLNLDWKDKSWSYGELEAKSAVDGFYGSILSWLKHVGVIPEDVRWKRAPMSLYNGLNGEALPGRVLAELAYEFDKEGAGSPMEYLEWLQYEIKGHPRREQLMAVLATLGKRGPRVTS